mmetsp:Transcript_11681/g.18631  ORF Transcript_11681/g.18631 Transcript_11681/m.18631 type:complete len:223 (+) Transcript_11681:378-1046(+)
MAFLPKARPRTLPIFNIAITVAVTPRMLTMKTGPTRAEPKIRAPRIIGGIAAPCASVIADSTKRLHSESPRLTRVPRWYFALAAGCSRMPFRSTMVAKMLKTASAVICIRTLAFVAKRPSRPDSAKSTSAHTSPSMLVERASSRTVICRIAQAEANRLRTESSWMANAVETLPPTMLHSALSTEALFRAEPLQLESSRIHAASKMSATRAGCIHSGGRRASS